jgi:hypothetical protein
MTFEAFAVGMTTLFVFGLGLFVGWMLRDMK